MSEHNSRLHAVLSPSSAERWATCPASVRLSQELPEPPSSSYADEGTAMHELAEVQARFVLVGGMSQEEHEQRLETWRIDHAEAITDEQEMFRYAREYVDLLRELRRGDPGSVLLLEQRVQTGVPSCWGTADAVLVSPRRVTIVDLKYGKGVQVDPVDNPQLKLYGVGALETFGDMLGDVSEVHVMVFQPRLNHALGEIIATADLRAWRDEMILKAEVALSPDAPFGPSEDACRWCPASGNCEAQLRHETSLDFGALEPSSGLLDVETLADILPRLDSIEAWCKAVREHALSRAYHQGEEIPGYKVVLSNGQRKVTDPEAAIESLEMLGFEREQVTNTKIKGIGELEKLGVLGAIAPYIGSTERRPSLVPDSDGRPAIASATQAALDFAQDV